MNSEECMTARARVRAVHAGALVDVEFLPAPRCRGCEGSCAWFRTPKVGGLRLRATTPLTVGETVLVSLPVRYILLGAVLLHGLPWAMLVLGGLAGSLVGSSDLSCLIGAVIGFSGTLVVTPAWHRRLEMTTLDELRVVPGP